MTSPPKRRKWGGSDYALAGLAVAMAILLAGIVVAAVLYRAPHHVLALATRDDCLRRFDGETCRDLVAAAWQVHLQSAPRYLDSWSCETAFGSGRCRKAEAEEAEADLFVPEIAVILAAHDAEPRGLLPLYLGPKNEKPGADGARRVYYSGAAVGYFSDVKFGGADLARVADLSGIPMTVEAVAALRGE